MVGVPTRFKIPYFHKRASYPLRPVILKVLALGIFPMCDRSYIVLVVLDFNTFGENSCNFSRLLITLSLGNRKVKSFLFSIFYILSSPYFEFILVFYDPYKERSSGYFLLLKLDGTLFIHSFIWCMPPCFLLSLFFFPCSMFLWVFRSQPVVFRGGDGKATFRFFIKSVLVDLLSRSINANNFTSFIGIEHMN